MLPLRRTSCVSSIAWVIRAGMAAACVLSGLDCAAARNAGSARVRPKTKRELRRIENWSFISRPLRRFEFGPNANASELKEPQLTPRKNSYKGLLADGAWTEAIHH